MLLNTVIVFGRPHDGVPVPRHVEVGIGDRPGLFPGRLSLNHKTPDASLRSTTEFVGSASAADIESWRAAIPFAAEDDPFSGLTIAVEDASPDTCLALYCLKERLAGRMLSAAWVEFASAWEQGHVLEGAVVDGMAGALISALTHAMADREGNDALASAGGFHPILSSAVDYVAGLAAAVPDPWNVPRQLPSAANARVRDLHEAAHASLAREKSHYDRVLASALKVQLSVPIAGTRRRRDVDAVFVTEVEFTGILKVLLRRDPRAPLGQGYPLWGLYRPMMWGSGNDMTISTDPAARIDLKQLWIEIERAEEMAWAEHAASHGTAYCRPREPVREGMQSFKQVPPICLPSQQPWWEGRPLYSMIAAPRSVNIAGRRVPGTRLGWVQILRILWRLYAPVQNLPLRRAEQPDEAVWRLLDDPPPGVRRVLVHDRTELFGVRLSLSPTVHGAPADWSPLVAASLAAFVDVGRVDIDRLPSAGEFDVIEARGGIAIVTTRGMLLLEVAPGADFPMHELHRAANDVAATLDCAKAIVDRINQTVRPLVLEAIGASSSAAKRDALRAVYAVKLKAREVWAKGGRFEEDILVRQFRAICEQRWNGSGHLTAALDEIRELETMVQSSSEVRANAILNKIAFVGFPLSICGNLLGGFVIAENRGNLSDRFVWLVLIIYVLASLIILAGLWIYSKISDRKWQPDLDI
jgi:hypothetical protein